MAPGPGNYDAETTRVRERVGAAGVILVVFDGFHGNGLSVQASPDITARLPAILREVADAIELDLGGDGS